MSDFVEVYPVGLKCSLFTPTASEIIAAVPCFIESVQVKRSGVVYEVVYWNGGTRNTAWVDCGELIVGVDLSPMKIGFKGGAK